MIKLPVNLPSLFPVFSDTQIISDCLLKLQQTFSLGLIPKYNVTYTRPSGEAFKTSLGLHDLTNSCFSWRDCNRNTFTTARRHLEWRPHTELMLEVTAHMDAAALNLLENVGGENFLAVPFIQLQHLLKVVVSRNHLSRGRRKHVVTRNTNDRWATSSVYLEMFSPTRCFESLPRWCSIVNSPQKVQVWASPYQDRSRNRSSHTLDEPVLIQLVDGLQVVLWRTHTHTSPWCPPAALPGRCHSSTSSPSPAGWPAPQLCISASASRGRCQVTSADTLNSRGNTSGRHRGSGLHLEPQE